MWLSIHGRGLVDATTRERLERRLHFALGRFSGHVQRVSVYLSDVNGPRGGADKLCRITAEMPGHGRAVVEGVDDSLMVAIDRTAERVGQAVRRRLDRARGFETARPSRGKSS